MGGMNYLAKKQRQARVGNNHPNVVPYQVMPTKDGHFILTASNDEQFARFCKVAGEDQLMEDERFNTMKARVVNRPHVTPALNEITRTQTTDWWLKNLEANGVGCAPILHLDEVFADPHVQARGMEIRMPIADGDVPVSLIGSPMKFSRTKVNYRVPPPRLGEHTDQVLMDEGFAASEIAELRQSGVIGPAVAPVTFEEQVDQMQSLFVETGAVGGSTWDKVKSMSVPNAAAFIAELKEEDNRTRTS